MVIQKIESTSSEVPKALALVWQTFLEFEAPDYSEQGIQEFKEFIALSTIRNKLANEELVLWGFYEEKKLLGVIAVRENNHISLLFVDKDHHYKGIARKLCEAAVDYSLKKGNKRITVNSSPYAVTAYHKLGFTPTDKEQSINGIRFLPMERLLRDKSVNNKKG